VGLTLGIVYLFLQILASPRTRLKADYRLVMVGGLLSDFIDKPVGLLLHISGRAFAHTLVFASIVTIALAIPLLAPQLYPRRISARLGNPAIYLVPGIWTHLLFDRMWELPKILLWPSQGLAFPSGTIDLVAILQHGIMDPYLLTGELSGLATILILAIRYRLYLWGNLRAFLRAGHLS
jgi:hypothetical protein